MTNPSSLPARTCPWKASFSSKNPAPLLESENGGNSSIWKRRKEKNLTNFREILVEFSVLGCCVSVRWHCSLVGMFWLCLHSLQLGDSVMASLFLNLKPCAQLTLLLLVRASIFTWFSSFEKIRLRASDFGVYVNQKAKCGWAGWFLSAYFLGGFGEDGRGINGLPKTVTASAKSWALGIPVSPHNYFQCNLVP